MKYDMNDYIIAGINYTTKKQTVYIASGLQIRGMFTIFYRECFNGDASNIPDNLPLPEEIPVAAEQQGKMEITLNNGKNEYSYIVKPLSQKSNLPYSFSDFNFGERFR